MKAAARHVGIAIAGIVTGCALSLAASASRASTLPPGLPDLPDLGETMQRDNRSGLAHKSNDQSTQARNVCCRTGALRLPRPSNANRSANRSRICPGANTRTHAAANSIANGNPSNR